jgi:hypothetical protein
VALSRDHFREWSRFDFGWRLTRMAPMGALARLVRKTARATDRILGALAEKVKSRR